MCCFHPTKEWCFKQVVFVNGKEGTLVLGSPTGPWPWPPPNLARSRSLATWDFYRKKIWKNGSLGWFETWFSCFWMLWIWGWFWCLHFLKSIHGKVHVISPSCHLLTTYHPIPISNPLGCRTDCCAPSFYLGSESDVSDFTKTIKTSKKTAICFRSRPVKHMLESRITGTHHLPCRLQHCPYRCVLTPPWSQGRCDGSKCLSVLDKNQFHLQQ